MSLVVTSGDPETSSLKTSFQEKISLRNTTGISHPVRVWEEPPNLICFRIDRARAKGAGLGWHFRQEIPRGFEFRQKHSRRKAAVPQANACSVLRTGADTMRFKIVGVSATLLSIEFPKL